MNKYKNIMTVLGLAVAFGAPASASADYFTFDPTGGAGACAGAACDIANIAVMDQAPGNALALGGGTAIANYLIGAPGTSFTLLYQANLGTLQYDDSTIAFANGAGGDFFNFVAAFGEKVVGATPYPGTATFALDSTYGPNYFRMCASGTVANNLTGAGFGCSQAASIMYGTIDSVQTSNFQVTSTTPVNLDQSPNGNQWGTQKTVTGAGSTDLVLHILGVDSGYFPTLNPSANITLSFLNTSQVDPYKQVDPSMCVYDDVGACYPTTATLGPTNGDVLPVVGGSGGPDILMQADANSTLSVPEPGTMALLGLGLLGLYGFRKSASRRSM